MTAERLAHLQAQLVDAVEELELRARALRSEHRRADPAYYAIEQRIRMTLRDIRFTLERDAAAPPVDPAVEIVDEGPMHVRFRLR